MYKEIKDSNIKNSRKSKL